MSNNIEKLGYDWITEKSGEIDVVSDYYCQTRDIFQARLNRMIDDLLKNNEIEENKIYAISAVAGEIGNNSFDHNLGNWDDVMGIFFAYDFIDDKLRIVLADRGQGVLKTLKKVKPELKNDSEALNTAFTERISGRAPEARGNGLKFSKESIKKENMHLIFTSGNAQAELNREMEIKQIDENIKGCLVILTV
ncbi:hypothetical protein KAI56_04320 [Candidatus Parcubacteria bacterium]|nr:hypothetical protein [Candidatus Parcubacteria bacterium]